MHTKIDNEIARSEERLAEMKAYRKLLDRFPEVDPFEGDTVIFFRKTFSDHEAFVRNECQKTYAFAAIKVECKGWYLTGGRYGNQPLSWSGLIEFMSEGVDLDDVWYADTWLPAFSDEG